MLGFSALGCGLIFDNSNIPSRQQEHVCKEALPKSHQCASGFSKSNAEKDPPHQRFFGRSTLRSIHYTIKVIKGIFLSFFATNLFSKSSFFVKPPHQHTTPNPLPTFTNLAPNIACLTRHMSSPCRSWP